MVSIIILLSGMAWRLIILCLVKSDRLPAKQNKRDGVGLFLEKW
jgi:hypothetical protein